MAGLRAVMDHPGWAADTRFATALGRFRFHDEIDEHIRRGRCNLPVRKLKKAQGKWEFLLNGCAVSRMLSMSRTAPKFSRPWRSRVSDRCVSPGCRFRFHPALGPARNRRRVWDSIRMKCLNPGSIFPTEKSGSLKYSRGAGMNALPNRQSRQNYAPGSVKLPR